MTRPYNGFSGEYRNTVGREQSSLLRLHPRYRHKICKACGHTGGVTQHLEDYREPLRAIVGLCLRCHVMVHERFARPQRWIEYQAAISAGWVFPPAGSWPSTFTDMIFGRGAWERARPGESRGPTFLDRLDEGRWLRLGLVGAPPPEHFLADWDFPGVPPIPPDPALF